MGVGGCEWFLGELVFRPFQAIQRHLQVMVVVLAFFGKLHHPDDMIGLYFARFQWSLRYGQKPVVASAASADLRRNDFCPGELKFFFETLMTSVFDCCFVAKWPPKRPDQETQFLSFTRRNELWILSEKPNLVKVILQATEVYLASYNLYDSGNV